MSMSTSFHKGTGSCRHCLITSDLEQAAVYLQQPADISWQGTQCALSPHATGLTPTLEAPSLHQKGTVPEVTRGHSRDKFIPESSLDVLQQAGGLPLHQARKEPEAARLQLPCSNFSACLYLAYTVKESIHLASPDYGHFHLCCADVRHTMRILVRTRCHCAGHQEAFRPTHRLCRCRETPLCSHPGGCIRGSASEAALLSYWAETCPQDK